MSETPKKKTSSWASVVWAMLGGYIGYQYFTHGTLPFNAHKLLSGGSTAIASKPREVLHLSSLELYNTYHANEVAADERFKDKDLVVTGRVESINKNAWNAIYITLETPNRFMATQLQLGDEDKSAAAALRKGQRVQVRCTSMQMVVGSPMGSGCRILSTQ